MSFGDKLRALIEEWDITQKELATQLNIAPSTLSSYVQNTREPDFETLKLLARYFVVTTDYLLDFQSGHTATREEDEILRIFRCLTEEQKIIFTAQGKAIVQHNVKGHKISKMEFGLEYDSKK